MFSRGALRLSRWSSVALGFTIPISVAADNLLFALTVLCWLAAGNIASRWESVRSSPIIKPLAGFIALTLISFAWTDASSAEMRKSLVDIVILASIPLFITLFRDARTRELAVDAFLTASAIVAAVSLLLATGFVESIPGSKGNPSYPIAFKTHITHNFLLVIAAVLFVMRAMQSRGLRRAIYAAGALVAAFDVIFVVPGRTGQAAIAAAALYLGFSRYRWRGLLVAGTAIAVVGAASWFSPTSVIRQGAELAWVEASQWASGGPQDTSIGLRFEYYANSLQMIAQRPLHGVGAGGFPAAYREHIAGTPRRATAHPHNSFLLIAVELSLLGLGFFLWLLVALWRAAEHMHPRLHTVGARALLVVFVAAGLVSSPFTDHAEAMYFAWSMGLFLGSIPAEHSTT